MKNDVLLLDLLIWEYKLSIIFLNPQGSEQVL